MARPGPPAPLLEIAGLASHYGRIQALAGIDLKVAEGELLALVGANGAGKTTLLKTISGVQPASAGSIRFAGADITAARPDRRVRLGIAQVPEGRQVFAPLSVADNLALGAYTRPRAELAAALDKIYAMFPVLKDKRRQPSGTLSGGQQQMLAIGRALMARPRLLLLDEPSMGLAPLLVEEIFGAITALKTAGTTIFLVEQNAHAALAIADRGYVLETGRIVLQDSGPALLANQRVKEAYLGL
ncbi:MAG: ABC transporter ATP-binding protein [Pseudomonadota bacterium]